MSRRVLAYGAPLVFGLAGSLAFVLVHRRWLRSRAQPRAMSAVLQDAEAAVKYCDSSPIYGALMKGSEYASQHLSIRMYTSPDSTLETLFMRVIQKDVAKGVIGECSGIPTHTLATPQPHIKALAHRRRRRRRHRHHRRPC